MQTRPLCLIVFTLALSRMIPAAEAEKPPAPVPADPQEWKEPAEKPLVKERVGAKEYSELRAKALAQYSKTIKEEEGSPERAVHVDTVRDDGQAAELGIRRGDLLLKLDDLELSESDRFNDMRKPVPQKLTVWSPKTKTQRVVDIQPGKIGVNMSNYRATAIWRFKRIPQDPRWEENIRLAAYLEPRDAALAETCLFHALKAGCPASLETEELAGRILYSAWRFDEAMNYAWFALKDHPDSNSLRGNFVLAAWSLNKYPAALAMRGKTEMFPALETEMRDRIAAHQALPVEKRAILQPLVQAPLLYQDCLLLRGTPFPTKEQNENGFGYRSNVLDNLFMSGMYKHSIETDHYNSIAVGSGAKNILVSFNFQAGPHDAQPGDYLKHFSAGVFDLDAQGAVPVSMNGNYSRMLGLVCDMNTWRVSQFNDKLTTIGSNIKFFDAAKSEVAHSYKLAIWNGVVQLELDGRTLYSGPVGRDISRLGVVLKGVGTTVDIWNLQIYELMDEAQKSEVLQREINKPYRMKYTRIHRAADKWDIPSTKDLLQFKPDLSLRTQFGEQPIHCAIRQALEGKAQVFVDQGAKLDLLAVAGLAKKDALKEMLAATPKPDVNLSNCHWKALHGAALSGDAETINALLDAGADINARTLKRWGEQTPLIWAVIHKKEESVKALLARGADVNMGDERKNTALFYAERVGNDAILKLLKDKNAAHKPTDSVRPPGPPPGDF